MKHHIPAQAKALAKRLVPPWLYWQLQQRRAMRQGQNPSQRNNVLVTHFITQHTFANRHTLALARYILGYGYRALYGHFVRARHLPRYFSPAVLAARLPAAQQHTAGNVKSAGVGEEDWYLRTSSMAIMPLPPKDAVVQNYTGIHGNNIRKATKNGYRVAPIEYDDHLDEIFAINTSKSERQGRSMSASYWQYPQRRSAPLRQAGIPYHCFGCFGADDVLRAYVTYFPCGNIYILDKVLGHGAHLTYGIMNLLFAQSAVLLADPAGTAGYLNYLSMNHTMGGFKERLGFAPYNVLLALPATAEVAHLVRSVRRSCTQDWSGDWLASYLKKQGLL